MTPRIASVGSPAAATASLSTPAATFVRSLRFRTSIAAWSLGGALPSVTIAGGAVLLLSFLAACLGLLRLGDQAGKLEGHLFERLLAVFGRGHDELFDLFEVVDHRVFDARGDPIVGAARVGKAGHHDAHGFLGGKG